jgi:RHS repeat-associated protein
MNDKMTDMALSRDFHGRFLRLRSSADVNKTLGNGVEYTAVFDAVNRQVSCTWEVGNQTLAGYNYAYDDASNREYEEKIHDPSNSQLYQYDTLYQVKKFEAGLLDGTKTSILAPDRTQGWNYDPMGNWRRFIDSDAIGVNVAQRRNHNEVNELIQITDYKPEPPVATALAYDANGNLLDDGEYLYSWDAFNRLVEVRLKADSSVIVGQYFYDAMHRRTKRLANLDGNTSLETQATYVYDGFNCIYEIPNPKSAIPPTAYVWGNDIIGGPQAAGGVGGLVAILTFSPQPSAFYPLFDARGNITAYTSSSGILTATFEYLPFGALASSTGNADTFSYRFSTRPFDPETGLVYYNFRYYSPELGRWMSRDPAGEGAGWNLYVIVASNPINWIDSLGLAYVADRPLQNDTRLTRAGAKQLGKPAVHRQIFFEDYKEQQADPKNYPSNLGLFDDDKIRRDDAPLALRKKYVKGLTGLDDALLRQAIKNIEARNGTDWCLTRNCQDFVDEVLEEYRQLKNPANSPQKNMTSP